MLNAKLLWIALAVSILWFGGTQSGLAQEAARVSVCDIARDIAAFEGRIVEVDGHLQSDFHHASLVVDPRCPGLSIMFGRSQPDAQGMSEFNQAWMVTRSCPQDGLMFTLRGKIERQFYWDLDRWVISATSITNLRRAERSECPMTMRELTERIERARSKEGLDQ